MRDSQSLLEQLLSFGGQQITVADVHALLGTANSARLAITRRLHRPPRRGHGAARSRNGGHRRRRSRALAEQLLGYFRDCLAALVGCRPTCCCTRRPTEQPQAQEFGEQLGLETLLAMAQILDQTLGRLRQSTHVRTLVEVALVRLCKLEDLDALPSWWRN